MVKRTLPALAALFLAGAGLAAAWAWTHRAEPRTETMRGSSTREFVTTTTRTKPEKPRPKPVPKPVARTVPWPTYGFDSARSHVAGFDHRPPFRRVWLVETGNLLEFPPAVGYGKVYVSQVKGRFLAIDAKTGKIAWEHDFKHCEASSPALWRGIVYQTYMQALPCDRGDRSQRGFLVAMDAESGKILWRFDAGAIESSPLIVRGTVYFGSWDHHVYALNARTKTLRWRFEADDEVNTSVAYSDGAVFFATDAGSVYSLDARTGRLRWERHDGSEYFYATPTVAYGRVFIGNTNGAVYAYGARTGDLLWVAHAGTYVYTAAAVWNRTVYVGSYDGGFYAFDAATGDQKWR
ncbi:MAG: PQQ-binding-like beta-propeller repeat protein, partial [Gaiellaceae bacterium]